MSKPRTPIPVAKPWLDDAESHAVQRVLASGWTSQGPEVAAFEQEFAEAVGAPYACAVNSCTSALHLALLAVGVGPGDEVITVSHSFIASANAVRHCGAEPVFVDIDLRTFNMDPELVEPAITKRTRAILCVHQMGMPCDLEAILDIGQRHGLPVVEDAACALGSEIKRSGEWETIGTPHGDVACFSLHPRKVISCGHGGVLTTSSKEIDTFARLARHNGMSVSDRTRHESSTVVFESYPIVGYNYNLTDIQAAVAREQLVKLPEIIKKRRYLGNRYRHLLADIANVKTPELPNWASTNWQSYCVHLAGGVDAKAVMQEMHNKGVATRRGIMNAHREKAYSNQVLKCSLPHSEEAQDHCVLLPLYHVMTDEDHDYVVETLDWACRTE